MYQCFLSSQPLSILGSVTPSKPLPSRPIQVYFLQHQTLHLEAKRQSRHEQGSHSQPRDRHAWPDHDATAAIIIVARSSVSISTATSAVVVVVVVGISTARGDDLRRCRRGSLTTASLCCRGIDLSAAPHLVVRSALAEQAARQVADRLADGETLDNPESVIALCSCLGSRQEYVTRVFL